MAWKHPGISQKEASVLLSKREEELEMERRRDFFAFRQNLKFGCDSPNKGDLVDRCRNDFEFKAADKKMRNNLRCLEKIEAARKKIADDSYGICKDCEEQIPLARLQLRPETEVCAPCKKFQKKWRKITGRNFGRESSARARV